MKIFSKQFIGLVLCLAVGVILLMPSVLFASGYSGELTAAVKNTNLDKTNIYSMIGLIVKTILGVLGVLLLVIIIYAGIIWGVISQGDPAQIKKAKSIITNAVIGLVLVVASYSIASYILTELGKTVSAK